MNAKQRRQQRRRKVKFWRDAERLVWVVLGKTEAAKTWETPQITLIK